AGDVPAQRRGRAASEPERVQPEAGARRTGVSPFLGRSAVCRDGHGGGADADVGGGDAERMRLGGRGEGQRTSGAAGGFGGGRGAGVWGATAATIDSGATIDPANGNVYVPAGSDSVWAVGLNANGGSLWAGGNAAMVFNYVPGSNNPQRAQSAGCLSHD